MKKKITILGAGISGIGAAKLAVKEGYDVFLSELGKIAPVQEAVLNEWNIDYEQGTHDLARISQSDIIIKSPGIPPTAPVIMTALEMGIPVIDELEFASQFTNSKIIIITGTNGKTTTTLLTTHIINKSGLKAIAVGNVGVSFADTLANGEKADAFVIEASSFQLDCMKDLRASAAMLLNITPDHLDRYGEFEEYVKSKHRVENLVSDDGIYIYNKDQQNTYPFNRWLNTKSISCENEADGYFAHSQLIIKENDVEINIPVSDISLKGKHNFSNALCAILACRNLQIEWDAIKEGLATFPSVPHRLENVGKINNITFINDSKATNIDATKYALDSFDKPIVWIAGGVDKGNDYSLLNNMVKNVKSLVCLGKDNTRLFNAFKGVISSLEETTDILEAVRMAYKKAKSGDVVLLAPACASFDLFQDFEDRGDQFRWAVSQLEREINDKSL